MKTPIEWIRREQRFLSYRNTEGVTLFESIDTQIASIASEYLPAGLTETQLEAAFLLFCCCHRHTRDGHILFRTDQLKKIIPQDICELPSADSIHRLFQALSPDFNQCDRNPIYWETDTTLYIRNYRMTELRTAQQIATRATDMWIKDQETTNPDSSLPELPETLTPSQLAAIKSPLEHSLTLISGGPGTGKTYTVFQAIRVILHQKPNATIQLLAPTGKAVARIQESIRSGLSTEIETKIGRDFSKVQAATIHRFLRQRESSSLRYQPYPKPAEALDYVIVDEASMIDLQLLSRLLSVVDIKTRLIMIGDISQLASVQPGAAFADVFESCANIGNNSIPTLKLDNPFRFQHNPKLSELCDSIREGNSDKVMVCLEDQETLQLIESNTPEIINSELQQWLNTHFLPHLSEQDPARAIQAFSRSMILCVQNEGPFGVHTLNRTFSRACMHHQYQRSSEENKLPIWKPIMVRKNDYSLRLFNGDSGVIQQSVNTKQLDNPIACFQSVEGDYAYHPQHLLPEHSDAYAITVHKSQGSEADHVLLILPNELNPLLTRELLYTAVSRAKKTLKIIASPDLLKACISNPTIRESRLRERIQKQLS